MVPHSKEVNLQISQSIWGTNIINLWSQANSKCERFMRNLGNVQGVKKRTNRGDYHATPHSTMGKSPAFALFGCEMKIEFPITLQEKRQVHDMRQRDANQKTKMKEYTD